MSQIKWKFNDSKTVLSGTVKGKEKFIISTTPNLNESEVLDINDKEKEITMLYLSENFTKRLYETQLELVRIAQYISSNETMFIKFINSQSTNKDSVD